MELRSNAFTALLGALAGAGALLLMSQSFATSAPLRVAYVPDPRDYVTITEASPLTVPAKKVFVLTGLGTPTFPRGATPPVQVALLANGNPVAECDTLSTSGRVSIFAAPEGITIGAGTVVSVNQLNPPYTYSVRAVGYLYKL